MGVLRGIVLGLIGNRWLGTIVVSAAATGCTEIGAWLNGDAPGQTNPMCLDSQAGMVCTSIDAKFCLSYAGCNLDGGCVQRGCEGYTTYGDCYAHIASCNWVSTATVASDCRWKAESACSNRLTQATCEGNANCIWLPGCGGALVECDDPSVRDEVTCNATGHCRWDLPSIE